MQAPERFHSPDSQPWTSQIPYIICALAVGGPEMASLLTVDVMNLLVSTPLLGKMLLPCHLGASALRHAELVTLQEPHISSM